MSSGWGCQHLTKFENEKEWCRLLKRELPLAKELEAS